MTYKTKNMKINIVTTGNKKSLRTFVNQNNELKNLWYDSETFESLQKFFDENFIYNQEQLEYVKNEFDKTRK